MLNIVLLVLLLPFLAISGVTLATVLIFRYKKDLMRAVDPLDFPNESRLVLADNGWAEEHGFDFVGSYLVSAMGAAYVAAWQKGDDPTYFCAYYLSNTQLNSPTTSGSSLAPGDCKLARDFVTILDGTGGLTTGNSADALLFPPPPKEYKQTFPGVTLQQQWERHGAALEYLKRTRNVRIRSDYATFEEALNAGIREPAKYVMSLFLWPLRGPYWYFIRRSRMRGRSVEELIRQGWIK